MELSNGFTVALAFNLLLFEEALKMSPKISDVGSVDFGFTTVVVVVAAIVVEVEATSTGVCVIGVVVFK